MKLNFKEVWEGWRNHLLPPEDLKEMIEKTSQERLSICQPCEFNTTPERIVNWSRCQVCGCPLKQKSKSLHSECPKKKWGAVLTKEEAHEINVKINVPDSTQHSTE